MRIHGLVLCLWASSIYCCPFLRQHTGNSSASLARQSEKFAATSFGAFCGRTNSLFVSPSVPSTCSAYREIQALFNGLIGANVQSKSAIFGTVIRFSFHDAGEIDITNQNDFLGPDGCLASDGSSNGLTESSSIAMRYLEPIYQVVCDRISRADFWALLGLLTLEKTITPPIPTPFYFGRRDNTQCDSGGGRLPRADGGMDEIERVFVRQMGFTIEEAVTLIGGGHSLGHTHIEVSGYGFQDSNSADPDLLNAWDNTPDVLDNDIFVKLTTLGWRAQLNADGTKQQWRHQQDPFIMLNTDMAVAYPLDTTPPTGHVDQFCQPKRTNGQPKCKRPINTQVPTTWELCKYYAQDNNAFQLAFVAAFTKMTCVGYGVPAPYPGATSTGKLGTLTTIDLSAC